MNPVTTWLTACVLATVMAIALPARDSMNLHRINLARLLPSLDEKIATLNNLVLQEQISRFSQIGNRISQVDSFEALVDIADGTERYTDVRRNDKNNDKNYSRVDQIDGVWSYGETVTMLRTTRDALNDRILQSGATEFSGDPEFEVGYRYAAGNHRWFLTVGPKIYWLDFEASVRFAAQTGDLRRIAWTSSPLPPETGVGRVTWTVDFQSVEIAGRLCTVPETAVYRIARNGSGHRADWNVTKFSGRGRYGSETSVSFQP